MSGFRALLSYPDRQRLMRAETAALMLVSRGVGAGSGRAFKGASIRRLYGAEAAAGATARQRQRGSDSEAATAAELAGCWRLRTGSARGPS